MSTREDKGGSDKAKRRQTVPSCTVLSSEAPYVEGRQADVSNKKSEILDRGFDRLR